MLEGDTVAEVVIGDNVGVAVSAGVADPILGLVLPVVVVDIDDVKLSIPVDDTVVCVLFVGVCTLDILADPLVDLEGVSVFDVAPLVDA